MKSYWMSISKTKNDIFYNEFLGKYVDKKDFELI